MIRLFWHVETIAHYTPFLSTLSGITANTHLLTFLT